MGQFDCSCAFVSVWYIIRFCITDSRNADHENKPTEVSGGRDSFHTHIVRQHRQKQLFGYFLAHPVFVGIADRVQTLVQEIVEALFLCVAPM